MEYIEIQNKLISAAQELFGSDRERVDAVVFKNNEFIVFINTHASSYPQVTNYISPGGRGYDKLKNILK